MHALNPKIVAILQKYMREPHAAFDDSTALRALGVDDLDLPMIFLDIEDIYDVQVSHADESDHALTVGGLIRSVASSIDAKQMARAAPVIRRPKRSWVSTGAER